jgi:hypothetical protein
VASEQAQQVPVESYLIVNKDFALLLAFRLLHAGRGDHVELGNAQFLIRVGALFFLGRCLRTLAFLLNRRLGIRPLVVALARASLDLGRSHDAR